MNIKDTMLCLYTCCRQDDLNKVNALLTSFPQCIDLLGEYGKIVLKLCIKENKVFHMNIILKFAKEKYNVIELRQLNFIVQNLYDNYYTPVISLSDIIRKHMPLIDDDEYLIDEIDDGIVNS